MKLVTWNVAGLRACEKKGFVDFVDQQTPDVLCLQETKASPDQLSDQLVFPSNYLATYAPAEKKGYSGVTTWVRKGIEANHHIGLGIDEYDREGRTIISEFSSFILFNCYFPNGQRDHQRVPYKLAYSRAVADKALQLSKQKNKSVIICGDYNTAHHEIDLANPKSNIHSTGFLPIERQWLDEFQAQGFIDFFRMLHPTQKDAYTWWTFRSNCRERNIGWRLDYFWGTGGIQSKVSSCQHLSHIQGSDHCPVQLEIC